MPNDEEKKAAIARLVAAGKMTREEPGCYPVTDVGKKLPKYDVAKVSEAFPTILQIDIDKTGKEWSAILLDGRLDDPMQVPFGTKPPKDTEQLIEVIRKFFKSALNSDALDETAGLLEQFETK